MDTDESASEQPDESADAFAALSDPTRVEILRALWDTEDREATFSQLREQVGMRDSGQFNYHLGKLTDEFVRQTDDGTYELRLAGVHVVGSLLSGTYTGEAEIGPVPGGESCPDCGSELSFSYDDDTFTFECDSCDPRTVVQLPAPPGVFEPHEESEAPEVARQYLLSVLEEVRNGFCLFCKGPMATDVESDSETLDFPYVTFSCERCGMTFQTELGMTLSDNPAVVVFYHDHGEDVRDVSWADLLAVDTNRAWVEQADPFRVTVRYLLDGDALEVTVDDSLDVIETRRTDG